MHHVEIRRPVKEPCLLMRPGRLILIDRYTKSAELEGKSFK